MQRFETVPSAVIQSVQTLSIDAIQKANSGHPGTPMGAAEMTLLLWSQFLRFDPAQPLWRDRDRFVLSAGHASMLQYSLLHLFGYDLSMDDLKAFRVVGSRTAGHPEYGHVDGVEMTTGPLGQGVSSAVGMALGQLMLAGKFNRGGHLPVQGRVWALAGDGCLMEDISSEAASLAGHWGLGNLTVIYDKNDISIDGDTAIAFSEDVAMRYRAYGWNVIEVGAYDQPALAEAFEASKASLRKPTLIIARSVIGKGAATLEGSPATHGAALGDKEIAATKAKMGWTLPPFSVPAEAYDWCKARVAEKQAQRAEWEKGVAAWRQADPAAAAAWDAHFEQQASEADLLAAVEGMEKDKAASRKHGGKVLNNLVKRLPWLLGGSADLTESNGVHLKDQAVAGWSAAGVFEGRNVHFGVREHAMGAIANGLSLHGAWRGYGSTFLQFADYMRPSIRLAALMQAKSIFVFTHDSIFLGEDGPTHQPVEHIACLRMIPGLAVWRPGDGLETGMAWSWAAGKAQGPVALLLSRQNLPLIEYPAGFDKKLIWKGGYVLREDAKASLTIVATGSELGTALEAVALMAQKGVTARVVSLPCAEVFKAQDAAYRAQVLGTLPLVSFEAGSTAWWPSLLGSDSLNLGVDSFGLSGPGEDVAKHFGLSAPQVAERMVAWLGTRTQARV